MAVESVQCPKCGAPLSADLNERQALYCSYCGAGLKLERGASGHTMAILEDIKSDTSLIATHFQIRQLQQELSDQYRSLRYLYHKKAEEQEDIARSILNIRKQRNKYRLWGILTLVLGLFLVFWIPALPDAQAVVCGGIFAGIPLLTGYSCLRTASEKSRALRRKLSEYYEVGLSYDKQTDDLVESTAALNKKLQDLKKEVD